MRFNNFALTLDANKLELSLEPVNRSETYFLTTVKDATALCNAINHPRVGVTIDTFHANIEEKDLPQAVRSCRPKIEARACKRE